MKWAVLLVAAVVFVAALLFDTGAVIQLAAASVMRSRYLALTLGVIAVALVVIVLRRHSAHPKPRGATRSTPSRKPARRAQPTTGQPAKRRPKSGARATKASRAK